MDQKINHQMGGRPIGTRLAFRTCRNIKQLKLQDMGHHVLFIIGDFTARIGDPTGKSTTRRPLSETDVKQNATTYLNQVFKLLDEKKTNIHYNSTWLNTLSTTDIISLCAKLTVARMLERDDFSKRFKTNSPIGIHEFLYPLLQGYDSVHLNNDIEIGGTDRNSIYWLAVSFKRCGIIASKHSNMPHS